MMVKSRLLTLFVSLALLTGCSHKDIFEHDGVKEAQVTDRTRAGDLLANLPEPADKTAVALYDFQDQTGQFKYNDKYTDYSSAVTKGGLAVLTKALLDAGNKKWFTVTERGGLKDLLQERQIIKVMRSEYHPNGEKLPDLPPLVYAGMLIEGGIVSYDSNIITGGLGAIYLGIGGNVQYHRDMVTVYLRAVSIQTGEVLLSVTSSKTIYSTNVDSNVLKYITFDRLLQAEAGFSINEPTQLCVRQAIETAVYSMIMEGAIDKLWEFKDPQAGQRAIADYLQRRDGPAPDMQQQMQKAELQPQLTPQAAAYHAEVPQHAGAVEPAMPVPSDEAIDALPSAGMLSTINNAPANAAPANAVPPFAHQTAPAPAGGPMPSAAPTYSAVAVPQNPAPAEKVYVPVPVPAATPSTAMGASTAASDPRTFMVAPGQAASGHATTAKPSPAELYDDGQK